MLSISRRPRESELVFWLSLLGYLCVAVILVLGAQNIVGDAWSRVGNAYYVLFSRDPHLAAIGFVWNPLPSLLLMPLLLLHGVVPALVQLGLAANLVSAVAMAATVAQMNGVLTDLVLPRRLRVTLVVLFAVHPMTLLYAANGMSEALFLLWLVIATRQLMRWLRSPDEGVLVRLGLALALAYLTRYEAVAAAVGAVGVVALISFSRSERANRKAVALADALVVGLPFAATFAVWAVTSWVIVGSPFETFTSIYGNSSQVGMAREGIQAATGQGTAAALGYGLAQLQGLEPIIAGIAVAVLITTRVTADIRALAPAVVFGGVLAFAFAAFLSGSSFGWLRFYIAAIPLAIVWTGWLCHSAFEAAGLARVRGLAPAAATFAIFASLAALVSGGATMLAPTLGREEAYQLHDLVPGATLSGAVPQAKRPYAVGGEVARYLDGLQLPAGSVIADVATAFPVVLQSADPKQFIITPDRDFNAALTDPAVFGVRFMVVQSGSGSGQLDAVGRAYSVIARETGTGVTLVRHFGAPSDTFGWDLYAVEPLRVATTPGATGR